MKKLPILSIVCFLILSCITKNTKTEEVSTRLNATPEIIKSIKIDDRAFSGLDLTPVKNANDPERRLFQKMLYSGPDLSIYVVSSETASAYHESYGLEEFLYLINGRASLTPHNQKEILFQSGELFMVPKGFKGEWKTQGGDEFLIELSAIATKRPQVEINPDKTLPYLVDKDIISGIGIETPDSQTLRTEQNLFTGLELSISTLNEVPGSYSIEGQNHDELKYVLSGSVTITPSGGTPETYYSKEFFILPNGFSGSWVSEAHGFFRSINVERSPISNG